jgi:nickel transport system substrate-binding protein
MYTCFSCRNITSSLAVRKAIIHAVNKAYIIQKELGGLEEVAHAVFARDLPYCNIDLFPLLDFDTEKANLLLDADGWKVRQSFLCKYIQE